MWGLLGGSLYIVWTQTIATSIFSKFETELNSINSVILLTGMLARIYGLNEV
jgi:hypothetical protein